MDIEMEMEMKMKIEMEIEHDALFWKGVFLMHLRFWMKQGLMMRIIVNSLGKIIQKG